MKSPPWRISSGGTHRAPTAIFFSVLLEAVIHLAAAENAAEALTTSLGSANKRHKVYEQAEWDNFLLVTTFQQWKLNSLM